ncbi:MAG: L-seryl-tRNA(Sec) selenium transferase [Armatimonadetes bacterium]|nr:L-seryl-tRNA(Sec) selenium transferase [Armatimonadota bacterium]
MPRVDDLIARLDGAPPAVARAAARNAIERGRSELQRGCEVTLQQIVAQAQKEAGELLEDRVQRVINMSGTILHTGLGRAPLPLDFGRTQGEYAALEFSLETGERGDRQAWVREHLIALTGAEDSLVVNNCAGAVLLALAAISAGKEVILSRGEMVEIGGSFRVPEIIAQSGCRLKEVGTTNKTRASDYSRAVGKETGAILRCHTSNYKIVGFTETPSVGQIAAVAKEKGVPFIFDFGTGCMIDLAPFGLPGLDSFPGLVSQGVDLVLGSGDKLLGGPQAGIIVGRKELIAACAAHPLARALRVDKLTLAALEAVLRAYRTGQLDKIPLLRILGTPLPEIRRRARALAKALGAKASVVESESELGAGCSPDLKVPTYCVAIKSDSPTKLYQALLKVDPPVIGRIEKGLLLLDCRTIQQGDFRPVKSALEKAL